MKRWILSLAFLANAAALNAFELNPGASTLNFVTVKNDQIAEVMSFGTLSGKIDEASGDAVITIPLDSVESGIDIRNTRMREMLFDTANFKTATYSATIDMSAVKALKPGEQLLVDLGGQLTLRGQSMPVEFATQVLRLESGALQVSTLKPGIVNASAFDLVSGIGALQSVAKLNAISLAVPVTFNVVFE